MIGYEEFEKVINEAKAGSGKKKYKLVFDSASRMSRDSKGGCELYEDLFNSGVDIEFLKEPYIDTKVYRKALDNQIQVKLSTFILRFYFKVVNVSNFTNTTIKNG